MRREARGRKLDSRRAYKPLDVGAAGVSASVAGDGRLLYVAQAHPDHGLVTLTALAPFDEALRADVPGIRRYRRKIAQRRATGFGLQPAAGPRPESWLLEDAIPSLRGGAGALTTFVPHPDDVEGAAGLVQLLEPAAAPARPPRWQGRLLLARAPYPELTEAGPLPPLTPAPTVAAEPGAIVLEDRRLGWAVALGGDFLPGAAVGLRGPRVQVDALLAPGQRAVVIGLGPDGPAAARAARRLGTADPEALLDRELDRWRRRWAGWPPDGGPLDPLARHGLGYLVSCCAVPVGDAVCLVTDHRILPLAWTRDGYFMARALLHWGLVTESGEAFELVRRHLRWLFETARRPDGWWARSHLAGGQPKDRVFQLDQQLYPLIELADYVAAAGDRAPLDRYAEQVRAVLAVVERQRDPTTGLYATEETAADDPLDFPYVTANQVLVWYAFTALAELGVDVSRLRSRAASVRRSVGAELVVDGPDGPLFTYARDGRGRTTLYHDANDWPLALAPGWGFCDPDDAVWRRTIAFANSPANPGWFAGRFGGLGSRHTPAPWPLGGLQAVTVGAVIGDRALVGRSVRTLLAQTAWDDALPEASDARRGAPVSRAWFAWPGAVAASLVLGGGPPEPKAPGPMGSSL